MQHPGSKLSLIFGDGFGHMRATGHPTAGLEEARAALFDRQLLGANSVARLPGVETYTQKCGGEPAGPFVTRNWRKQHPGEVRFSTTETKRFGSQGGDQATADVVNPVAGGDSCRTVGAEDDPGAATYRLPAASGPGYTLMG